MTAADNKGLYVFVFCAIVFESHAKKIYTSRPTGAEREIAIEGHSGSRVLRSLESRQGTLVIPACDILTECQRIYRTDSQTNGQTDNADDR